MGCVREEKLFLHPPSSVATVLRRAGAVGARARTLLVALLVLGALTWWMRRGEGARAGPAASPLLLPDEQGVAPVPGRELPLIFIGGVPRSGTTLMRAMLDAHGDVRCGQETRVVPRILQMRQQWVVSEKETLRLEHAGITKAVLNNAVAAFCLEVIRRHGDPAPRLCNKDPHVVKLGTYVLELFPNARFVFMVRDGRATVHSIMRRKVMLMDCHITSARQCLGKWNHAVEVMAMQCRALGDRCLLVRYETLVLQPERTMRAVLAFLRLPWSDNVLHHERFINLPHGVALSQQELSSDQVVRAVNLDALDKWAREGAAGEGAVWSADVLRDAAHIAPMLSVLGYDPWASPPDYRALPPTDYNLTANAQP